MMKRVNLELPEPLLEELDAERGDVPRNAWIRRAIEERLRQNERWRELNAEKKKRTH